MFASVQLSSATPDRLERYWGFDNSHCVDWKHQKRVYTGRDEVETEANVCLGRVMQEGKD
ncbi:hypothetical protein NTGBS_280026 [Candidatus Nitrotoga sp. BS]|nr:hypothetical protein NTGBS_280026 [Candidatus Nitrotoga sp. BS]